MVRVMGCWKFNMFVLRISSMRSGCVPMHMRNLHLFNVTYLMSPGWLAVEKMFPVYSSPIIVCNALRTCGTAR